jgi:signal transduction histidine kinase
MSAAHLAIQGEIAMLRFMRTNTSTTFPSEWSFASDKQVAQPTKALAEIITAELLSSQEKERKRIASELHDSIGQSVGNLHFGIGVAVEMIRTGRCADADELLSRLGKQAKLTIEEIRRIAMDLRPASLDDLGIVHTLSWFFREFQRVHPELTLATEITVKETDIPVTLTTPIYRVIQESCNNVVRHSRANRIHIAIHRLTCSIHLLIEDNGHGMQELDKRCSGHHGLGLRSMRDRVELSGGCLYLESETGTGTRIIANWPLSATPCPQSRLGKPCPTNR